MATPTTATYPPARPNPSRRRRRPGAPAAAAVLATALGLLACGSSPAAAQQSSMTIQAVPDSSQLSSKGSQAGCDHYRNGYLGLALCVNFYDDHADGAYAGGMVCWVDRLLGGCRAR